MKKQGIFYKKQVSKDSTEYLIDPVIYNYLQKYFNLSFYRTKVPAPYYINTKKRKDLRALVGKGTPEEMVLETKVWAQVKNFNLKRADKDKIRRLMIDVGIGIDCSGLVYHSYNAFFKEKFGKSFKTIVKPQKHSIRSKLGRMFRAAENINADDITSELNCVKVKVNDVRPGDFIRGVGKQRNAYHVGVVTRVLVKLAAGCEINQEIDYIHSHINYGDNNGVRQGKVIVKDPEGDILDQEWKDNHTDGINYLLENDLKPYPQESGFRRLKFFIT